MNWVSIAALADRDQVEQLEELFWATNAVSVTVTDAQDQPLFEPGPGEIPLWEKTMVTGLYEEDVDPDHVKATLKEFDFDVLFVESLGDRVWEREWLSQFKPMKFGRRLWVCPSGYSVTEPDAVVMDLDPGLAFGTGTHATTRMCLNWLDQHIEEGATVLDYGAGSGVLAIAALLLGAGEALAVDNDPQALVASTDNASRNKVSLDVLLAGKPINAQYDVVVANILAQPLVELAGNLQQYIKPGGHLVLSGIMSSQKDWVLEAYELELADSWEDDGWVCLQLDKRSDKPVG